MPAPLDPNATTNPAKRKPQPGDPTFDAIKPPDDSAFIGAIDRANRGPSGPGLGSGGPAPIDPSGIGVQFGGAPVGGLGPVGTYGVSDAGVKMPYDPVGPGVGGPSRGGGPAVDNGFGVPQVPVDGAVNAGGVDVTAGGVIPIGAGVNDFGKVAATTDGSAANASTVGGPSKGGGPSGGANLDPGAGAGGTKNPDAGWTPPAGAIKYPDGSYVLDGERVGPPSMMTSEQGYVPPDGGTGSAGTGSGGGATADSVQQAYLDALLKQLNPTPLTADSINQNPAAAAYRVQTQRGLDKQRQSLAERASAEGTLGSGGFDSQVRGADQQAAESNAGFTGSLGMHLFDQQRQELQSAIAAAQQAGQFSMAQKLQLKLAQMQASAQNNQLGFNYAQLQTQANRDALLAMLGL